jgi:amino acid transporter
VSTMFLNHLQLAVIESGNKREQVPVHQFEHYARRLLTRCRRREPHTSRSFLATLPFQAAPTFDADNAGSLRIYAFAVQVTVYSPAITAHPISAGSRVKCFSKISPDPNAGSQKYLSVRHASGRRGIKIAILTVLIAVPNTVNWLGVRSGAAFSTAMTIAKLLPILRLVLLGTVRFLQYPHAVGASQSATLGVRPWASALLLVFTYAGFESVLAPAGEVKSLRRTVPFGLTVGLLICTAVYFSLQLVIVLTVGTSSSEAALVDTASILLGRRGALFVGTAVMVSTYGWLSAATLYAPRLPTALALQGRCTALPRQAQRKVQNADNGYSSVCHRGVEPRRDRHLSLGARLNRRFHPGGV